jgi:hypothetical protein
MMRKASAFASVTLLGALAGFQAALAAGLPAAQFAWGGRFNGTLPIAYRWASVAALPMLALAAWVVLARADIARPGSGARPIRTAAWAITAFLALNALGNLMSGSPAERLVMTPLSLLLFACFANVAASAPPAGST